MRERLTAAAGASALGRIPGYDLAAPSDTDVRFALERHFGREEADDLWWEACAALGLPRDRRPLALPDVERVAAYFECQTGMLRIVGRSMLIRIRTYALLRERRGVVAAPSPPPSPAPSPAPSPDTAPEAVPPAAPTPALAADPSAS